MSEVRFKVLDTVRRQLAADPDIKDLSTESAEAAYARILRTYQRTGTLDHGETLELFYDRLRDWDSELVFTNAAGIADAVLQAMRDSNETLLLVPTGLTENWLPSSDLEIRRDENLPLQLLQEPRTVLTGCTVAVAMSGTIILEHGDEQGRRAATLLPDHHICVIRKDQVVETIAEAITRITRRTSPITTIAGPSATSDIEMTRVRGVHGPRRLTAVIV
ncbi:LUD domain-containing protein [Terriglobus sp. TAA 43]|uniref:LutC/YkgG family protein n=1 Tax=Terriglobus sp. TAA 43 TaxID=278961 RepID=UPI000645EA9B|nr:LUD domain-containing protein [Terriglobus sp. TAA 43]